MDGLRLRLVLTLALWAVAAALFSCSGATDPESPPQILSEIRIDPYPLHEVTGELAWYENQEILELDRYHQDEDGVVVYLLDGHRYYHPIRMALTGLRFLDNYHTTGDSAFLERAILHADKLTEVAHNVDGVPYYPFPMDWPLHGIESDVMVAPWYSGMSQGEALSLFTGLAQTTGDPRFRREADRVLGSFLRPRHRHDVFTVEVDDEGYYWIEEYAKETRNQVLNGFIFSLFGLVDYYHYTGSDTARLLAQAAITTLREYAGRYRTPDGISIYCMSHRRQIGSYHPIHIGVIRQLHAICRDRYFLELAKHLEADYQYVPHGSPGLPH